MLLKFKNIGQPINGSKGKRWWTRIKQLSCGTRLKEWGCVGEWQREEKWMKWMNGLLLGRMKSEILKKIDRLDHQFVRWTQWCRKGTAIAPRSLIQTWHNVSWLAYLWSCRISYWNFASWKNSQFGRQNKRLIVQKLGSMFFCVHILI